MVSSSKLSLFLVAAAVSSTARSEAGLRGDGKMDIPEDQDTRSDIVVEGGRKLWGGPNVIAIDKPDVCEKGPFKGYHCQHIPPPPSYEVWSCPSMGKGGGSGNGSGGGDRGREKPEGGAGGGSEGGSEGGTRLLQETNETEAGLEPRAPPRLKFPSALPASHIPGQRGSRCACGSKIVTPKRGEGVSDLLGVGDFLSEDECNAKCGRGPTDECFVCTSSQLFFKGGPAETFNKCLHVSAIPYIPCGNDHPGPPAGFDLIAWKDCGMCLELVKGRTKPIFYIDEVCFP